MIIFAALLASGQALPWIDRKWLDEQVRLEASALRHPKPPLKLKLPEARDTSPRLKGFANTNGM